VLPKSSNPDSEKPVGPWL